jgi:hypothetical protein
MITIRRALFAALLAAAADAQTLVAYVPAYGPSVDFVEFAGTSSLFPAISTFSPLENSFGAQFPLAPGYGGPGPVVLQPGDLAIDATTGQVYYSNGPLIAVQPNPTYAAPIGAALAPFPATAFPPLPFLPGGGTLVTGLAVDPAAGLLWMTNGYTVLAASIAALPSTVAVVTPFAPAIPPAFGPMTGLEWDGATGQLLACDAAGFVVSFFPGGAFGGSFISPVVALPGTVTGVTIDKTTLPTAAGVRSVYLSLSSPAGDFVLDTASGGFRQLFGAFGSVAGVAFHANAARHTPAGCPCGGLAPTLRTRSPSYSGNPAFGVDWLGLPPFGSVLVAADLAFDPSFPSLNGVGCPLILGPSSPSFVAFAANADATGRLSLPVSLAGIPPGVALYLQYATVCTADPTGLVLSSGMQVTVTAL